MDETTHLYKFSQNYGRFSQNYGRYGDITGIFIATEGEVAHLTGRTIYFGEILGKHSEVICTIDPRDITILPVRRTTIEDLQRVCGLTISGYNPLSYLEEKE